MSKATTTQQDAPARERRDVILHVRMTGGGLAFMDEQVAKSQTAEPGTKWTRSKMARRMLNYAAQHMPDDFRD